MDNKNEPGKFIVFEGLDGSGKTTQAKLLSEKLKDRGEEVWLTFEQTEGVIGRLIQRVLDGEIKLNPKAVQFLFIADRLQHLQEIEKALARGKTVICDRYFWSTIAYGGSLADWRWWLDLHRYCRRPDLTIYVKVSPGVCLQRINVRQNKEKIERVFEKEQKLEKVAKIYNKLISEFSDSTVVVDGEQEIRPIADQIEKAYDKFYE